MAKTSLTLGTAQIYRTKSGFALRYMNHASFLVGEQRFSDANSALRFCRQRDLRVIEKIGF